MPNITDKVYWHEKRINLLSLYNFLREIGLEPEMPLFLEKPSKWGSEYRLMLENPDWDEYTPEQLDALCSKIVEGLEESDE